MRKTMGISYAKVVKLYTLSTTKCLNWLSALGFTQSIAPMYSQVYTRPGLPVSRRFYTVFTGSINTNNLYKGFIL
jgi:hypothetical protein